MLELDVERDPAAVLAECRRRGLVVKELRFGASSPPERRHWHIRRPEGPGTLELTEDAGRVWLTVKPRWDGGWASILARRLTGSS